MWMMEKVTNQKKSPGRKDRAYYSEMEENGMFG